MINEPGSMTGNQEAILNNAERAREKRVCPQMHLKDNRIKSYLFLLEPLHNTESQTLETFK